MGCGRVQELGARVQEFGRRLSVTYLCTNILSLEYDGTVIASERTARDVPSCYVCAACYSGSSGGWRTCVLVGSIHTYITPRNRAYSLTPARGDERCVNVTGGRVGQYLIPVL